MGSCCSEINRPCCCSESTAVEVSTSLTMQDVFGAWKVRWGINRMNYKIDSGLYYVGRPNSDSPVLVTANYKLSFDALRKELSGISAWILVLDTKGVNVWCAAGKGTFGTEELVKRLEITGISKVVSHRTLILPQLGAVGVSAHEVMKRSGFKVVYGPVRAEDIPKFLKNGMKADQEMRTVNFNLADRAVLTPVEIVGAVKPSLILFGMMFLLNQIGISRFTGTDLYAYFGAVIVGCVLTPILLPWIPGRAFSLKGWFLGLIWSAGIITLNHGFTSMEYGMLTAISYLLVLPSVSAFYAMNFTGCSTFTSFSGVIREMKISIPLITISIGLGVILLITGSLLSMVF
ncbi:mercury methylation corrinoid protein HgcA [Sinanaerobacter chloroacetimidivorans]|uniref:Acetyl-CoA synthase subunit gamma n=1 Tax=Sinanaerobacter chloroacetimidivorans TaxID=2818044 RepID=A0A8J7VX61_9FIRM|nr:mercury methylation corrinoid protein HgcA [Sinanaerobacter chloroacetimidivorans]MBR0596684.1 acetyl-CoA synthase subunit gamma [Sinanaerobacter chloroacetimidivorans]